MKISIFTENLKKLTTQALIIPIPEGQDEALPPHLAALVPEAAHQQFKGKLDEVLTVYPANPPRRRAGGGIDRLVLVGLGDGTGTRSALELFRRAVASGVRQLTTKEIQDIAIYLGGMFEADYIREAVLMSLLAPYKYTKHLAKKEEADRQFRSLTLVAPGQRPGAPYKRALEQATHMSGAITVARDLVNAPSNHLTPTQLAKAALEVASTSPNLSVTVWGRSELAKRNFGALLAVARGSVEEPQLITLEYHPSLSPPVGGSSSGVAGAPQLTTRSSQFTTVVLVGKGVTFDTGGINLKPWQALGDMHMDMAGGAAVIATLQAVAALALPIRVVGIVPATENMPSGTALKPTDIITSRAGTTIEIVDTDAEGRLILADGLDYAKEFKPDLVIDLATLTGAALVALGEERAAVIGNDQALVESLIRAGETAGEPIWQLPLDDEYRAHVKSEVADVNNVGKKKGHAGTIAGAAFLEKFIPKDTPWAHLDIAGTATRSEAGPYWPKGGSGWGVRLLVEFLQSL